MTQIATITPRLAESLNRRLLAASQLQIQAARSVALDTSALAEWPINVIYSNSSDNLTSCAMARWVG